MTKRLSPDICVIGGGSGGLSAAAAAAAAGAQVVLVERGTLGRDHLEDGRVPSQALIAAARHAWAMRHGAGFGIADVEPQVDYRAVARHVRGVIDAIAPDWSIERFTALGVRVIREQARFVDRRTVVAGDVEIRARHFVVAAGTSPAMPPIPGLDAVDVLTSGTIFDLTRLPPRLVIVGAGAVALELAQAYRRLGSEVTVIEAQAALGEEDPEPAAIVLAGLRAEGVDLRERSAVTRVERRGKTGVRAHVTGPDGAEAIVDGSHLLVATGREADVSGLDLDKAGIAFTQHGVTVDERLRSANHRVYAIGAAAGGPHAAGAAGHHADLVVSEILSGRRARRQDLIVPRVTLTDPGLAHVGLTEAGARAAHKHIRILRWPYAQNDRARAERRTAGFVKIVAGGDGRILGVSIVGADAGELIAVWALALSRRLTLRDMAAYVPARPTLGEIGKRAAISYFADAARKPIARRLVGFLRSFG